ncbi:hypothetical protein LLEC1_07822, partial [Akanthomyces lecanii]
LALTPHCTTKGLGWGYKQLLKSVSDRYRDIFQLDKFCKRDVRITPSTIWSRKMDFALFNSNPVRNVALFADMLAHSPNAKQCHAYDATTGDLTVLASADHDVND